MTRILVALVPAVLATYALAQTPAVPADAEPKGAWRKPGEIQQPKGPWLVPGEIQQPKGPWQKPGEIQVPKGIEAVKAVDRKCERRLQVVADALFEFDRSTLSADAEQTLNALLPEIARAGSQRALVEGHTDAVGGADYNQTLSEARATTVRDWLVLHKALPAGTPIKGYGKTRPVAPNAHPDGSDDPAGRQRNRRVEVVLDTCGS
jgi:outer membrane protein OmpA-like peptidoglycan-associated protein